jgi:hypothetical protein
VTSPVEGTYAPRSTLLRGAWAFPDDLDERRRGRLGDDEWRPLLMAASELLYAYSGRLWAGTFTDRARLVGQGRECRPFRPVGSIRPDPTWRARPAFVVRLPGDPVVEVLSVTVGDTALAADRYDLIAPDRLAREDGRPWRLDGRTVVEYRHGLPPPEAGVQAVLTYAYELGRARSSDKGCRLPESVQSVTRQGVSYQMVDRANAANSSRTGLPEVDQWLQSVNPMIDGGASARPRRVGAALLSPDLPPIARMIHNATE